MGIKTTPYQKKAITAQFAGSQAACNLCGTKVARIVQESTTAGAGPEGSLITEDVPRLIWEVDELLMEMNSKRCIVIRCPGCGNTLFLDARRYPAEDPNMIEN